MFVREMDEKADMSTDVLESFLRNRCGLFGEILANTIAPHRDDPGNDDGCCCENSSEAPLVSGVQSLHYRLCCI